MFQDELTLDCNLSHIPGLHNFIQSVADRLGMNQSLTCQVDLAVEEAVVNVINYAYPEKKGEKGKVTIQAQSDGRCLTLVVIDSGIPFDPMKQEKADTTLSFEERPIGGLGIFLVRELMDDVSYQRTAEGQNILTMKKSIQ